MDCTDNAREKDYDHHGGLAEPQGVLEGGEGSRMGILKLYSLRLTGNLSLFDAINDGFDHYTEAGQN